MSSAASTYEISLYRSTGGLAPACIRGLVTRPNTQTPDGEILPRSVAHEQYRNIERIPWVVPSPLYDGKALSPWATLWRGVQRPAPSGGGISQPPPGRRFPRSRWKPAAPDLRRRSRKIPPPYVHASCVLCLRLGARTPGSRCAVGMASCALLKLGGSLVAFLLAIGGGRCHRPVGSISALARKLSHKAHIRPVGGGLC